jgi:general stress protein 26
MDPSRHWVSMILYFIALLGTLIFKRAAKMKAESWMKKLSEWFGGEDEEPDAQELQDQKAGSV